MPTGSGAAAAVAVAADDVRGGSRGGGRGGVATAEALCDCRLPHALPPPPPLMSLSFSLSLVCLFSTSGLYSRGALGRPLEKKAPKNQGSRAHPGHVSLFLRPMALARAHSRVL